MNLNLTKTNALAFQPNRSWLLFLAVAAIATNLPRLILGPFSAVGILGDIGDYSVPYFMAAGDLPLTDRWIGEMPMGTSLYSSGFYAPAQQLLYFLFPGWLAHGINWLLLTIVSGTATFFAARGIFGLVAPPAAFAGLLGVIAVATGNFGYSVIAFIPLVLISTYFFSVRPGWNSAAFVILAATALSAWVPAKFLILFPAIAIFVGTVCLSENRIRYRIAAAALAIVPLYLLRAHDLVDFVTATASSDRHWSTTDIASIPLLLRGLEYVFEYFDPRLLLTFNPVPFTNPTTIGFFLTLTAFFFCFRNPAFRKLISALLTLAIIQLLFPAVWQWVLLDLLETPGLYFHPKLWRPATPLLFIGAAFGLATLTAYLTPKMTTRWRSWTVRRSSLVPLSLLLFVGMTGSAGFGLRSWIADGSYAAQYQDSGLRMLKDQLDADGDTSRAAIVRRPNAILAAYGISSPFGRRDWLAKRHALLVEKAGIVDKRPASGLAYTSLYYQRLTVDASQLPEKATRDPVLALLALSAVKYIAVRGTLERPYLQKMGTSSEPNWQLLSNAEKVRASIAANFSGASLLSVYRFNDALPRVRAVTELAKVQNASAAVEYVLSQPMKRLRYMAVTETELPGSDTRSLPQSLTFTYNDASGYVVEISSRGPAFIVVSEIFDGSWSYEINGIISSIIPVNGAFVGLPVPAGQHQLTLSRSGHRLKAG